MFRTILIPSELKDSNIRILWSVFEWKHAEALEGIIIKGEIKIQ